MVDLIPRPLVYTKKHENRNNYRNDSIQIERQKEGNENIYIKNFTKYVRLVPRPPYHIFNPVLRRQAYFKRQYQHRLKKYI